MKPGRILGSSEITAIHVRAASGFHSRAARSGDQADRAEKAELNILVN